MNIKIARRVAAGAVIGTALLSATPASAGFVSPREGVWAESQGTRGQVSVKDTAVDGNPVFARYYRRNGSGLEVLWNELGAGRTTFSNFDESHPVTWLQGCVWHNDTDPLCGPIQSI